MTLGTHHVETTRINYLLVLSNTLFAILRKYGLERGVVVILGAGFGNSEKLSISSEQDIGSTTCHVGRNRNGAHSASLRDNLRLSLMVFGV